MKTLKVYAHSTYCVYIYLYNETNFQMASRPSKKEIEKKKKTWSHYYINAISKREDTGIV